jgi:hypothetical protein
MEVDNKFLLIVDETQGGILGQQIWPKQGILKGEYIIVPLTSCLTGLESAV